MRETDPADEEILFSSDTDSVKYRLISRVKIVVLLLFAVDTKVIWNYCGDYFKNKYYKCTSWCYADAKVGLKRVDHLDAVEIIIDNDALTAFNQNFIPKEEGGITTGKKKFDALFDYLSKKLGTVKRHFFASSFEMMIDAVAFNHANKGSKQLPNLVYNIKAGGKERVWISFESKLFAI